MRPLAVIDDDPTGTQGEAGVPLLFDWSDTALAKAATDDAGAIHLLTNSRALNDTEAYDVVRDAATAVRRHLPERSIVLRGDSTLRAHLRPEYEAVRDACFSAAPPHVLVPALPAAGRITVGGVHWVERDGERTPVHATEYGADRNLGFRTSKLLEWAEERSDGYFAASAGREFHLDALRQANAADAMAEALRELSVAGRPAVLAPDAQTTRDIETIVAGLSLARERSIETIVRGSPAFVAAAAGTAAPSHVPLPAVRLGVLVLVGSHVPSTTRQLQVLHTRRPDVLVEIDPAALAAREPGSEIARVVKAAGALLAGRGIAVVATARETPDDVLDAAAGMRIARGLASVLAGLRGHADVFVTKGGITSAVTAKMGLGAKEARVIGPVVDGVALWHAVTPTGDVPLIVFPGNVGTDDALADLVDRLVGA